MKKTICILSVLACFSIIPLALAGNPHTIVGKIFNPDGTIPANGAVSFNAYIANRPAEVLTEKSPGCAYQNGWFQIGIGNFPTSWSEGEILKIEISAISGGEKIILEQELNSADPQIVEDIELK